jgi:photosynthetic reaction center cytochrome c subunit
MADFRWFSKWNRENPTRIWGPAYLAGAVGGGILVAALVVTWGYPWKAVGLQTGPRGTGMDVIKFEPPLARPDPTADAFYTEAAIVPVGGETLARDAYQNVQVLGDLTEDNFNRLMLAITEWVAPEQGCAYCHGDEGDFAGDQLYTKNVARHMIQMTQHINETYPEHVQPAGVTC